MKKLFIFILVIISTVVLWYFSIVFFSNQINLANIAMTGDNIIAISSSLFIALALAAISSAIILLTLKVNTNQINFENSVHVNNIHIEIIALSALIDECDNTLHRYDRWEEAGIKGDYMNAKTSVRDKMNVYREKLENRYYDIQDLNAERRCK